MSRATKCDICGKLYTNDGSDSLNDQWDYYGIYLARQGSSEAVVLDYCDECRKHMARALKKIVKTNL